MPQLYVSVVIDVQSALQRGYTQGGTEKIEVTEEFLEAFTETERELLAEYTAPQGVRSLRLEVTGLEIPDIKAALAREAEQARKKQLHEAEKNALMECPIDELLVQAPDEPAGRRWRVNREVVGGFLDVNRRAQDGTFQRNLEDWQAAVEAAPGPDVIAEGQSWKLSDALVELCGTCPGTAAHRYSARISRANKKIKQLRDERAHQAREAKEAERLAWIVMHGSERLKRCVAENIECGAVYRDERLALERPGWRYIMDVKGEYEEPRNPSAAAFKLLDTARATLPEECRASAEIVYWTVDADTRSYEEERYAWDGYVVLSQFLGQAIVYGGPK